MKEIAYITLKYLTLALIHSIHLIVQYTCPTVCMFFLSELHIPDPFYVTMLGGV